LIRPKEAYERIGISKTEGYRRAIYDPSFPKRLKTGCRSAAFLESDVNEYIDLLIERSQSKSSLPTSSQHRAGKPAQTMNDGLAQASGRSGKTLSRSSLRNAAASGDSA